MIQSTDPTAITTNPHPVGRRPKSAEMTDAPTMLAMDAVQLSN